MNLTDTIFQWYQTGVLTEEDRQSALELIMDESIESFCKANILQGDAEDLAIANESFVEHCASLVPIDLELVDQHILPEKYAYHLAYTNPELGTELLKELLYYRKLGRI